MADETFPLRYKFKRKTTAQWASLNPVLLPGEPGIEVLSDGSEKIKYGDGVKTWSALSYAAGGGAGGPALSNAAPQALGASAAPGTSVDASRADHVHPRPTAAQVGADASGTAAAAVAAHETAADPHPGYLTAAEGNAAYATAAQGALAATAIQPGNAALSDSREWSADTISQAEAEAGTTTTRRAFTALRVFQAIASWWNGSAAKTKLDGIETGAQVNVGTNLSYDATTRNLASSTGSPAPLPLFGSSAAGLVPASGGGTSNFLRADGTFAAPSAGTPGGSSGQIQFNNGGAFGGLSTLTADGSGNLTLSARLTNSYNAAASAPAKLFSGTWFTGGTSTTTKPHVLIEPSGTTSTNWSTAGTGFGVNAPSGFGGDLAWFGVSGTKRFSVSATEAVFTSAGGSGFSASDSNGANIQFTSISRIFIGFTLRLEAPVVCISGTGNAHPAYFTQEQENVLSAANSLRPQAHRIYNTRTSLTNFERGRIGWTGGYGFVNITGGTTGTIVGTWIGTFAVGQRIAGAGIPANTTITAVVSGTLGQTGCVFTFSQACTNANSVGVDLYSDVFRIGTEKGSAGGTARDMELQTDGVTRITVKADGAIVFSGIPTTNPNVAGQLWNDGGTLKISAG